MAGVKGRSGGARVGSGPRRNRIRLDDETADKLYQIVKWCIAGDDTPDRATEGERAHEIVRQLISDEWAMLNNRGWQQPGEHDDG